MYYALYRKYRPKNLNEIVGQDIIRDSLINSLKYNKISHAYLFSGPRGTGKTSIAKILARTVNCLEQENGICCGKCINCLDSLNNSSPDIIEIDAASNNGIDEIREIRNKVNLVPSSMKYKVYIIDEVHMLTTGAFNALLKTLEEPPSHVIFILATTDLHKVPITILSRCQTYNFKRITVDKISNHLKCICENEKITINNNVLCKIADYSDGCMRDSIGLLEKLISYKANDIIEKDLEEIVGTINKDIIILLINNISNRDTMAVIKLIDKLYNDGKEINFFVQDIISFLRNNIVDFYSGIEIEYPLDELILLIKKFIEINNLLKNSPNAKIVMEIGIIDFINSLDKNKTTDLFIEKEQKLEKDSKNNISLETKIISREIKKQVNIAEKQIKNSILVDINYAIDDRKYSSYKMDIVNNAFATANKDLLKSLKERLKNINDSISDINKSSIINIFLDSELIVAGENDLVFKVKYDSLVDSVMRYYWNIYDVLFEYFGTKYNFIFIVLDEWNKFRNDFINNKNEGIKYDYRNIIIEREDASKSLQCDDIPQIIDEEEKENIVDLFSEVIEFE